MGMVEPPRLSGASVKRVMGVPPGDHGLPLEGFVALGGDGVVVEADLAAVVEIAGGGG